MKLNITPAVGALLALTLIMGAGNLWASWDEVHTSQQRQEHLVQQKLCATYVTLAALKPPPGPPAHYPGRAYEQSLHATLDELSTDLGCK